ncbi:TetR/AcrR family transcriptional regulator [Staphylococcus haemolyticus]|uniref:TetR/AcrR family transcriptional regulator n=1 Tax=Staphylococcus haemolyticus TaxID=1283 RepID=UPI001F0ADA3E|nr:TetR/AcrR family transcriptional regulator [Staphylococcus haemolyticus]MCH4457800.1 TetR/AcrR family transcriptional regulator [Staphylococcus haemolyticus]MCH4491436.1 TetR/AcrR family transcriptional regulator [Staphylococcus haemolyticus]MDU0435460.1 TetR/AcrR family transcriptional regulator [Staphylococcus haemolyticus]
MDYSNDIKIDLELILKNEKITPGKQKVLISSINLFSKFGFNAVSTAEIAKNAGVSEATIFKYFKNKRGLLLAIITPIFEHCLPSYENIFANRIVKKENYDLKTLVHFVVDDRLQFLEQNKDVITIILSQILIDAEIRNNLINYLENNHDNNASKIFEIFHNTQELASDINYNSLLRIFMGQLLVNFTQTFLFNVKDNQKEQIVSQIYRALKSEEN